jgi:hypothetical protein
MTREYRSIPAGGYRKPNLEGLFDEETPPPVIRRPRRGGGPRIGGSRRKWRPAAPTDRT